MTVDVQLAATGQSDWLTTALASVDLGRPTVTPPTIPLRPGAPARRPARLNNAGVCIWCLDQWCSNRRCLDLHARSTWGVCDKCLGTEQDQATGMTCDCFSGVVETTPISLPAERQA